MAKASTVLKAEAVAQAFNFIIGSKPNIVYYEDRAELNFTPEQNERLKATFRSWLAPRAESDLKVNIAPALVPALVEKYGAWVLLPLGLGALLGKGIKM